MKMIVGLGNPGNEYDFTRHNLGFMIVDSFAKFNGVSIDRRKFNGCYAEIFVSGNKVILLKPMSFMNCSGGVVSSFASYFDIDPCDILVVSDDLALPFLKYRLRLFGSSGGHNGLKDIERCLGTNQFRRFRIGISDGNSFDATSFVLGRFSRNEISLIHSFYDRSCAVLNDFCVMDFDKLMSKYNG